MSPGVFEAFYQSPIQHPILLWASNLVGSGLALFALRAREGGRAVSGEARLRRFVLFWAIVSALDAWASANEVYGIGVLAAPWSSIIPFIFVWLGDFRIFFAMERFGAARLEPQGPGSFGGSARAVAACFVVPVLAGLLTRGQEARILFLVYEALFLVWILLYGKLTRLASEGAARRVRNLAILFYSLWVLADSLILCLPEPSRDLGFAVRVIANLIYYGWFGWVCTRGKECLS